MRYSEKEWPLDNSYFEELRTQNFHYVDKTAPIWRLANQRLRLFFLGRPRRFGKSLLTTTLRAYFQGKRELFEGLEAGRLEAQKGEEAWQEFPVLHFDMYNGHSSPKSLTQYIAGVLAECEAAYKCPYKGDPALLDIRFRELIRAIYLSGRKPVILVDEYDSPLAYSLKKEKKDDHERFKDILRGLYSNLKSAHDEIRFALLTGVSQFQQVSVFSGLNNIIDITLDPIYATICGITEEELRANFDWRVQELAVEEKSSLEDTYSLLRANYDGYRFTRKEASVYNPFSLIRCLASLEVLQYWYSSGTPYVLRVLLPKIWYNFTKLEKGVKAVGDSLLAFTPGSTNPVPILFQAGYLTIKDYERKGNIYHLEFPNTEVRDAFYDGNKELLLGEQYSLFTETAVEFADQISEGDVQGFMFNLRVLLANVPYYADHVNNPVPEAIFQSALYLVMHLTGKTSQMEPPSRKGRSDIEVYTARFIYIFEIKVDSTPRAALQQIIDKDYALRHANSGKQIIGIGMNFNRTSHEFTWIAKPKGEEVFGLEERPSL